MESDWGRLCYPDGCLFLILTMSGSSFYRSKQSSSYKATSIIKHIISLFTLLYIQMLLLAPRLYPDRKDNGLTHW
ncbi:hypothetical protein BDB01DRAFT_771673 [Pilobolus umbonatus]|nr:hypothetical protein BDB01DRAFT_771673 [Pilobolus umbonatus]